MIILSDGIQLLIYMLLISSLITAQVARSHWSQEIDPVREWALTLSALCIGIVVGIALKVWVI